MFQKDVGRFGITMWDDGSPTWFHVHDKRSEAEIGNISRDELNDLIYALTEARNRHDRTITR